jgi:hypothetical protein
MLLLWLMICKTPVASAHTCDVLHSTNYTQGDWLQSAGRNWTMCTRTIEALNDLHRHLHCGTTSKGGGVVVEHHVLPAVEWRPRSCALPPFNSSRLLTALSEKWRLLIVGDSVSAQQYFNLRCWLEQRECSTLHEKSERRLQSRRT